jgi:hypothetical protein
MIPDSVGPVIFPNVFEVTVRKIHTSWWTDDISRGVPVAARRNLTPLLDVCYRVVEKFIVVVTILIGKVRPFSTNASTPKAVALFAPF